MSTDCFPLKNRLYEAHEVASLHKSPIPHHVALIMDGNRRWERKQAVKGMPSLLGGHWAGARALVEIVEAAQELGIKVLTVYGFSTENWTRPRKEIDLLMQIFEAYLQANRQKMRNEGVRFDVIGDQTPLPESLRDEVKRTKEATKDGDQIDFIIALNYGGRDDMRRAIVKVGEACAQKKIMPEEITEELIGSFLDTSPWGDPDLLIRTSGECRISNFLLWQLAYAEIYVTDVLSPDFTPREFLKAIENYQRRQRRLGQ